MGWWKAQNSNTPILQHSVAPQFSNWRRRMGIEPTWDFVEPHTGFEDQERHQVALHLRDGAIRRLQNATDGPSCRFQTAAWPHWGRFPG